MIKGRKSMAGKIYLVESNGTLRSLEEQLYDSEDLLQTLLERYPDLLAGEQIDESSPRRWLLVSREIGVPDIDRGADRWSIDHLFLDQDGVPTLVEVKRSNDTRIRREVVGQMLDYAANSVVYWPSETIRTKFEARCDGIGDDPMRLIADLLEIDPRDEVDLEGFWEQVDINLRAGKVRLIFVADVIPTELRRIVEFLNEQMNPAEVLAVEIRQYVGEGIKTLVPKVIGLKKAYPPPGSEARQWDEQSFFEEMKRRCSLEEVEIARKILVWARKNVDQIFWGRGKHDGSYIPKLYHNGQYHWTIDVWTYGIIDIPFGYMISRPPFDEESKRLELSLRLNQIPGVIISDDRIDRFPRFKISILKDETALCQFVETLDWIVQEIRST
jgi:hypothetical protein